MTHFAFLLDLAHQTQGHAINEGRYRQLIYYGADEFGATFKASPDLEGVARRWRLYQAREYYTFALNALWCHLCDWGAARRRRGPIGTHKRVRETSQCES